MPEMGLGLMKSPLMDGSLLMGARNEHYSRLVRNTRRASLVGYWPLFDPSGSVAVDYSGQTGRNGAYSGVTFGQVGIGDGHQCPLFATSYVNVYSAALNTAFPRAAGTIQAWAKVLNAGVWTDGLQHRIVDFGIDTNNFVLVRLTSGANQIGCQYKANGATTETINTTAYALTTWLHVGVTWDTVADQLKFYVNGVLIATNTTIGGALTGDLSSGIAVLGAGSITPTFPWSGYLAHAALWNAALSAGEIARLARL
jgi:hypothetical protein